MFPMPYQIAHVAVLLLAQQGIQLLIRLVDGAEFPGFQFFVSSLIAAALWPVLVTALNSPLRRRAGLDDV
jgi:rod shape-determining protein MreD